MAENPLVTFHQFNLKEALCKFLYYISIIDCAIAGGVAGISVDFALFPIDSIKTRL